MTEAERLRLVEDALSRLKGALANERAASDRQIAEREARIVDLIAVCQRFISLMELNGEWDEGCFYYNKVSAAELEPLIRSAAAAIAKAEKRS